MWEAIETFFSNAVQSQMGQGLALVGILSYLAYQAKSWSVWLFGFLYRQFTTSVFIKGGDIHYDHLKIWLDQSPIAQKSRRLWLSNGIFVAGAKKTMVFSPGPGVHWFWFGTLTKIEFTLHESRDDHRPIENVRVTMVTRSRNRLIHFMEEARAVATAKKNIRAYLFASGSWRSIAGLSLRYANGYASEADLLDKILDDCRLFLSREQYYQERGLPYRRGYLFTGKPGTGKSTLVTIMATELNLPVYVLQLGAIGTDEKLTEALCSVPGGSILLIEDIDAFAVAQSREMRVWGDEDKKVGLTLSGLLNAIDGITSGNQRILVMTTNHPEKLDPALIRPGRVDVQVEIPLLTHKTVKKYLHRYYQVDDVDGLDEIIRITGAELQSICLINDMHAAVREINQRFAQKAVSLVQQAA